MSLVVTVTGVSLTEPHTDEMYVHVYICTNFWRARGIGLRWDSAFTVGIPTVKLESYLKYGLNHI